MVAPHAIIHSANPDDDESVRPSGLALEGKESVGGGAAQWFIAVCLLCPRAGFQTAAASIHCPLSLPHVERDRHLFMALDCEIDGAAAAAFDE